MIDQTHDSNCLLYELPVQSQCGGQASRVLTKPGGKRFAEFLYGYMFQEVVINLVRRSVEEIAVPFIPAQPDRLAMPLTHPFSEPFDLRYIAVSAENGHGDNRKN